MGLSLESSQFATARVEGWQFGYLAPCLSVCWSSENSSAADYWSCAQEHWPVQESL